MKSTLVRQGTRAPRCRIAALLAVSALALAGCAAMLPKLETPQLSLVSLKIQDASFFEQRLLLRLRVQNPNQLALPVRGIKLDFELAGEDFAQGVTARAFEVPANGEAEFDMLITANAATALLRIAKSGRAREKDSVDYRIRGTLSTRLGLLRSVPFEEKGTIALDALTGRGKDRS